MNENYELVLRKEYQKCFIRFKFKTEIYVNFVIIIVNYINI
jgi:hypothetical protein